jgi:hypothetical protein
VDRHHAETFVELWVEASFGDSRLEVRRRGCDHPDVDVSGKGVLVIPKFSLLDHTE